MAQLFFKYSTMNSGKSLDLLKSVHNYEEQGKKCLLFTSEKDTRNGNLNSKQKDGTIYTRLGITAHAWLIERVDPYKMAEYEKPHCIFVDEAQFLIKEKVLSLAAIVDELNIPVICYGLKNDFQNNLFEGSRNLLLYADKITELKTICFFCDRKATMNMRTVNNTPVFDGTQICIDKNKETNIKYISVCRKCYMRIKKQNNKLNQEGRINVRSDKKYNSI